MPKARPLRLAGPGLVLLQSYGDEAVRAGAGGDAHDFLFGMSEIYDLMGNSGVFEMVDGVLEVKSDRWVPLRPLAQGKFAFLGAAIAEGDAEPGGVAGAVVTPNEKMQGAGEGLDALYLEHVLGVVSRDENVVPGSPDEEGNIVGGDSVLGKPGFEAGVIAAADPDGVVRTIEQGRKVERQEARNACGTQLRHADGPYWFPRCYPPRSPGKRCLAEPNPLLEIRRPNVNLRSGGQDGGAAFGHANLQPLLADTGGCGNKETGAIGIAGEVTSSTILTEILVNGISMAIKQ